MIGDGLGLNLNVVKFSLDKGDLTGYYVHNGKSVRLRTLFSNGLNYDWFIQSIFISNLLLTSSLVIVHHSIIPIIVKTASPYNSDKLKMIHKYIVVDRCGIVQLLWDCLVKNKRGYWYQVMLVS